MELSSTHYARWRQRLDCKPCRPAPSNSRDIVERTQFNSLELQEAADERIAKHVQLLEPLGLIHRVDIVRESWMTAQLRDSNW